MHYGMLLTANDTQWVLRGPDRIPGGGTRCIRARQNAEIDNFIDGFYQPVDYFLGCFKPLSLTPLPLSSRPLTGTGLAIPRVITAREGTRHYGDRLYTMPHMQTAYGVKNDHARGRAGRDSRSNHLCVPDLWHHGEAS